MQSPPSSPSRQQQQQQGMACLEMEMEMDHSEDSDGHDDTAPLRRGVSQQSSSSSGATATPLSPLVQLAKDLIKYLKLWTQLYPRATVGAGGTVALLLVLVSVRTLLRYSKTSMTRNHLEGDYSSQSFSSQDYFQAQKEAIHHWCLFGGNDQCYCEDPTVGISRSERQEWSDAHNRNKAQIADAMAETKRPGGRMLDVVFVGDQTFEAWGEGQFLDEAFFEGPKIAAYFNQTFRHTSAASDSNDDDDDGLQGLSLGIYTDQTTNLLWRLQHGELPDNLQAKVFWILIGANDLALAMCSEDVVTLGILRVAEEIALRHPHSKVVIQGLLPRSNHRDGSLHLTTDAKRGSTVRNNFHEHSNNNNGNGHPKDKNNIWSYRTDQMKPEDMDFGHSTTSSALQQAQEQAKQPFFDYYIWPSILAINKELKRFCDTHSSSEEDDSNNGHNHEANQFVYFDADDLFVENVPGKDGKDKQIIREYMPNSILLSYKGHQVLMDAVKGKVEELLKE